MLKGLFITFEGPEGAGKSTQIQKLAEYLESKGKSVITTREPGGTPVSEKLAEIVKYFCGADAVCDESELLIFTASRAQLVKKFIKPELLNGKTVLCDRFFDSTTAYQGYARGFDLSFLASLHEFATDGLKPDLTFLIDIDLNEGFKRIQNRTKTQGKDDRIELEAREFHEKVRNGYLEIAQNNTDRFRVINGSGTIDDIHGEIVKEIDSFLNAR